MLASPKRQRLGYIAANILFVRDRGRTDQSCLAGGVWSTATLVDTERSKLAIVLRFGQTVIVREEEKEGSMRLLYIVTKGVSDATLASVPLHIAANGSLEIGQEVSVVLAGDATDLVIGDNARHVEGVGVPPMRELLSKLREHEVPVYV
jgi:hypothetical protein